MSLALNPDGQRGPALSRLPPKTVDLRGSSRSVYFGTKLGNFSYTYSTS